jgi:hypothetical protein
MTNTSGSARVLPKSQRLNSHDFRSSLAELVEDVSVSIRRNPAKSVFGARIKVEVNLSFVIQHPESQWLLLCFKVFKTCGS